MYIMCTERNYLCNGVMYFPSLKSCKRGIVPGETPCPWSMLGVGNRTQITRLVMSTEVVHIEWLASFGSLVRLFADCSASKRIACTGGGVERFQVVCMWPKCRKNIEHANCCNQLLQERADRVSHQFVICCVFVLLFFFPKNITTTFTKDYYLPSV